MSEVLKLNHGVLMVGGPFVDASPVVSLETSVTDALFQLERASRNELLVVDQAGQLAGIITESQLAAHAPEVDATSQRCVECVLTSRFSTESIPAAQQFLQAGDELRCLPVIEDGRLVSLLTDDDFFISWNHVSGLLSAAAQDQLTELATRPIFLRRLEEEWERSRRRQSSLALLMIDLDEFKLVNDLCGHLTGDRVLAEVGGCLRKQLRTYDIVGRIGGDEFAAMCCDCQPDDVIAPIARLRSAVNQLLVPKQFPREHFSLSVGAAVICGGFETLTTEALIEAADEALYAAKRAGRDGAFRMVLDEVDGKMTRELTQLNLMCPAAIR